ncbi:MAG: D-alanine--D-alanine ligase family protein [Minwuia sp.]|uniref:D-alanine--D-alanine ligase family protein n=1 Tax=Minwuia sp. TaxID=2493630 RepID=UPI003A851F64
MRRLAVITGDHGESDPTKLGAAYGEEDLKAHRTMVEALEGLERFDITVFNDHDGLFERLAADPPDLVVNFCDTGVFNRPTRELNLPAWLELHDIPYTGATPQAMVLCFDKQIVRLVAESLGVEVPGEHFLASAAPGVALPDLYPALLKPNAADGSVGITKDAVVRSPQEARAYLDFLHETLPGRAVLWQEYLPGPEYGVGLIGNPASGLTVLPPLEVDFSKLPAGLNPILSFESKADPDSPYWTEIAFREARIETETRERIAGWAKLLFARFGLQDYGRFDFRCAADGRPKMMETNPNPAWAYDGKLAFMAGFAGIAYPKMLERIVDAAIARVTAGG